MKEITILSGKGGTGKTSITGAFSAILGEQAVVCDADVDAPDLHLLLQPIEIKQERFVSGSQAEVDLDRCDGCGACEKACTFKAIHVRAQKASVDQFGCEGCGLCMCVCPQKALSMESRSVGYWAISKTRFGSSFVHALLDPGSENSGKLVTKVKKEAKALGEDQGKAYCLTDGPPGIGCPTIATMSGADHVLIVTEPSQSAWHDLKRLIELIRLFHLPMSCVINRSTIHPGLTEQIRQFMNHQSVNIVGELPYEPSWDFIQDEGLTIAEGSAKARAMIEEIWEAMV